MKFTDKAIYNVFAIICVATSFFLYSPLYTYHYNSDHAVHVLMAHDMHLPEDYYFWGQTRLGSMVPMLGYFLTHSLGIAPVIAVTLVQYGLMVLCCLFFCRYIKSYFLKGCLFVFWFMPIPLFPEIVYLAQPYEAQFFLIAVAIWSGEKYYECKKYKYLYLILSFVVLGISVWVSELSGLFYGLFALILFLAVMIKPGSLKFKIIDATVFGTLLMITAALTFWFVTYAKSYAIGQSYSDKTFIGWTEIKLGLTRHYDYFLDALSKPVFNFFNIVYAVFFIGALSITVYYLFVKRILFNNNYHSVLLITLFLNAVLSTVLIYMSDWVYKMSFEFRYWTYSFASLGLFLIMYWDKVYTEKKKFTTILLGLLFALQIAVSVKYAFYEDPRYWIGLPFSKYKEVKKLGSCGIIGNYWFSYVFSSVNPKECLATPHDIDFVRNVRLIPKVIAKDSIYLVKNNWLNSFPDTAYQFGVLLRKKSEPFYISNFEFCKYEKAPYFRVFNSKNLMYRNHTVLPDSTLLLNKDTVAFNDFVVFGPLSWLNFGTYKATFYLNKGIEKNKDDRIFIDVCSGWGKNVYATKELKASDMANPIKFEMEFELKEAVSSIEYRIFLRGKSSFVLEKIVVECRP